MKLGSLFSGRGGFEIGAEACGIETEWTCEIDEFLRHKLRRISTNAKQYQDVKNVRNPQAVDIISAGFPCQDVSIANSKMRSGIKGNRTGLWSEVCRITNEIKPSYLVLENSPELLRKGFEYILSDLSGIGYHAEWDCWRAADFGYPHNRRRLYVIAYPGGIRLSSGLLQPPGTFELSQKWTPTTTYIRVSTGRVNQFRNTGTIQRDNEFPNFKSEIKAFGNAVMPVIAEHLFRCILLNEKINKLSCKH
jgi:DNA (cytosine-5)-methyltransferase 1